MDKMRIEKLMKVLARNPRDLDDRCELFTACNAEEYKGLALFALKTLCGNQKFSRCRIDGPGWAAHHITKAIFEEQDIFDPYADTQFIAGIEAVCAWYVRRYTEGTI